LSGAALCASSTGTVLQHTQAGTSKAAVCKVVVCAGERVGQLVTGMLRLRAQIGNLQAVAQFLCNASKSLSGTLADVLSPARMIIFGTVLTTLNKPMFAGSGAVYAAFGTVATLYWVTAGERARPCKLARRSGCHQAPAGTAGASSASLQDEPSVPTPCLCPWPCCGNTQ